jgi:hypothetical protein
MLDKLAPCQILVVGCWQLNHLTSDISYYLLSGSGDPKDVFCLISELILNKFPKLVTTCF